jgi:putative nucleotidyltransferase with HDIG domain
MSLLDLRPSALKSLVGEIPTLPVIYQELFRKMQDPDIGVPEVAEIISMDQALAAKVLHLVNSAFYGYSKQIKTISRAVVILGFRAVRSAALAVSVFDYFGDEQSSSQVDMRKFWEHSVVVAAISKILAEVQVREQQEEAFIVGLLHDTGKLIEKRYFPDDFDEACAAATEQHLSWYECEKQLFNLNHAGIGGTLFRAWDFPPGVVEVVRHHHTPEAAMTHAQLASLVHVADWAAYELGHGAPGAYPPPRCEASALDLVGLRGDWLKEHEPRIREEISHAMEILKLLE